MAHVPLKQDLGLLESVVYGVGLILGAGIYAIIGEAAGLTGGSIVFSFLGAAIIASFTGLSYAELSSRFPKEEGDYIYVLEAFGNKRLSEFTALCRILMGVISTAAVALAFGGYFASILAVPILPVTVSVIILMAIVNYWGIDFSAKVNLVLTAIEILGLLLIIWIGSGSWGTVNVFHAPRNVLGVVDAAFLVFFAYLGFGSIVNISEETREATRTIPRAILISILVTTVLYVLVGLSAIAVVDWQVLGQSDAPLALVAMTGWGPTAGMILGVIALFSTMNTVLILQVSTSRLLYGVSKEEYQSFPTVFSRVHPTRKTPHYAALLVLLITLPFTLIGDIGQVAGMANLVLLIVFVLINAALLRIRFTKPASTGFRAPLNIGQVPLTAVAGLLSSIGLIVFYLQRIM